MRDSLSFRTLTGAVKLMAVGLVAALMVGGAAIAGNNAGKKINGSQLLNASVSGGKLKEGAVKKKHLGRSARNFILKQGDGTAGGPGIPGQDGPDGAPGTDGTDGTDGADGEDGEDLTYEASNWNVILRNNIGSPLVDLQGGPQDSFRLPQGGPPYGEGSLVMGVSDNATSGSPPAEKASFGNEVDFVDDPVLGLTEVGFHVYQTGESAAISPRNMPNITFEIDSNLGSLSNANDNYTSLVWVPDAAPVTNQWSDFIDATTTGNWYMTGEEGSDTTCTTSLTCDFDAVMTALDDGGAEPVIHTAAVGKGRDNTWFGAVDGLVINDTAYDFEPFGVLEVEPLT
jgi:hypothetical protein